MELNPVLKVINRLRNGIVSGNLRARSHLVKFPINENELKKCLGLGVVVYAFNPSTRKAETGGFLSLRPA